MQTPQDHRQAIEKQLKDILRDIRMLDRRLAGKGLTRQYKNSKCKSAIAQAMSRAECISSLEKAKVSLLLKFCRLPEVRQDDSLRVYEEALRFSKGLASRKRGPKYIKGQMEFAH